MYAAFIRKLRTSSAPPGGASNTATWFGYHMPANDCCPLCVSGQWTVGSEQWTVDSRQWIVDSGQ